MTAQFVETELSTQGSLLLEQAETSLIFPVLSRVPAPPSARSHAGCGVKDGGCRMQHMGYGLQDVGCWMFDAGHDTWGAESEMQDTAYVQRSCGCPSPRGAQGQA